MNLNLFEEFSFIEICVEDKVHDFLLEMVSSIQIDSMLDVSQWENLLEAKPLSQGFLQMFSLTMLPLTKLTKRFVCVPGTFRNSTQHSTCFIGLL